MRGSRLPESLRRALAARNLPENYVNRLIEELEDHAIRLLDENNSMDATLVDRCLGPSETLAEHAVREYRGRTFGGRHPIWTFVIAPILLTALLGAAWLLAEYLVCCGVELIAELATDESFFEPPAGTLDVSRRVLYHSLCAAFCYLPASAACLLLGRSAARAGRGWPWALAACSLAALIAGCFFWKILPITAERPGELCIFGFGWSGLRGMVLRCPQYLIPLSLGGWAFLRAGGAFADGRLAAAPK